MVPVILSRLLLSIAFFSVLLQIGACVARDWDKHTALVEQGMEDDDSVPILKAALQDAIDRQLEDLQALEGYLDRQIAELQRKKSEVQMKKRGHFVCRVHAIACYKKRSTKA